MQIAPKKRAGFNRDAPEAQKCKKINKMIIFYGDDDDDDDSQDFQDIQDF